MTRKKNTETKMKIFSTAYQLAEEEGLLNITRGKIGALVGVVPTLVTYYWVSMDYLKEEIFRVAIADNKLSIVQDGILMRLPAAAKLDPAMEAKALEFRR
jgi:AcrR family transcriptional regulator